MSAGRSFFVMTLCTIRGHHVHKEVWSSNIGESFLCFDKEENVHDSKAVAGICVERFVIGHLPQEISKVCFHYIY